MVKINPISPSIRSQKRKKPNDDPFLLWVSKQASCIDGAWNQWDYERGEGRNIPCHVRRQKYGAGLGIKPKRRAVPMTDAQHKVQSAANGERRVLEKYHPTRRVWTAEEAAMWFEKASDTYAKKFKQEHEVDISA